MSGSSREDMPVGSVHFGQEFGDEKPTPRKVGAHIETSRTGHEVWNNTVLLATCPTREIAELVLEGISPKLDSRAEWSFDDALKKARAALSRLRSSGEPFNGRAAALVETKLDEAELWFTKVVGK